MLGAYADAARRGALLVVPTADRRPPLRPRAGRRRGGARLGGHLQRPGPRDRRAGRSTPAGASRALQRERILERVRGRAPASTCCARPASAAGFRRRRRRADRRAAALARGSRALHHRRCAPGRPRTCAGRPTPTRSGRIYGDYVRELDRARARRPRALRVAGPGRAARAPRIAGAHEPVFFYGFDDLTALERDAVETLARVAGAEVTVSLTYEPGREALVARAETMEELRPLAERVVELPAQRRALRAGVPRGAAPPRALAVRSAAPHSQRVGPGRGGDPAGGRRGARRGRARRRAGARAAARRRARRRDRRRLPLAPRGRRRCWGTCSRSTGSRWPPATRRRWPTPRSGAGLLGAARCALLPERRGARR